MAAGCPSQGRRKETSSSWTCPIDTPSPEKELPVVRREPMEKTQMGFKVSEIR